MLAQSVMEKSPVAPVDAGAAGNAIQKMRAAGFTLKTDGAALRISPSDRLTADQRAYIRVHKVLLLEELRAESANDAAPPLVVAVADPLAKRIAELIADDFAPWCARARAESEALPVRPKEIFDD